VAGYQVGVLLETERAIKAGEQTMMLPNDLEEEDARKLVMAERAMAGEPREESTSVKLSPLLSPSTQRQEPAKLSPLQVIARDITRLPWREQEMMTESIKAKTKDSTITSKAIQDWAWEWEIFKEEERPR
jgi:hypothetical protein